MQCAFLDALMSTTPFPPIQQFLNEKKIQLPNDQYVATAEDGTISYDLRKNVTSAFQRRYNVEKIQEDGAPETYKVTRDDKKVEAAKLTEDDKKEFQERVKNLAKAESERSVSFNETYMFNYERLSMESRRRTTVHVVYRVDVYDFDGTTYAVEFEAEETYGLVAHAVYAEYIKDVQDLDKWSEQFLDCMFALNRQQDVDETNTDEGVIGFTDTIRSYIPGGRRRANPYSELQFGSIFEIAKYLVLENGLDWYSGNKAQGAPFKFEFEKLEERLAEIRMMAREIIPVWPPTSESQQDVARAENLKIIAGAAKNTPVLSLSDRQEVAADAVTQAPTAGDALLSGHVILQGRQLDAADIGAASPDDEAYDDFRPEKDEELEAAIEIANSKEGKDTEQAIALEEQNEAFNIVLGDELGNVQQPLVVVLSDPFSGWLRRNLPQIVQPGKSPALRFVPLECVTVNDDAELTEAQKDRGFLGKTSLATVAVATGIAAFVAFTIIATQGFAAAASAGYFASFMEAFKSLSLPGLFSTAGQLVLTSFFFSGVTLEQQLWRANVGVPFAVNFATSVYSFTTSRLKAGEGGEVRLNAYLDLRKHVIGNPVEAAVLAATSALNLQIKLNKTKRDKRLGETFGQVSIVYNQLNSKRFVLYEYFGPTYSVSEETPVYVSQDWHSVPDSNALVTYPPAQVAEKLHEAETLRNIPVARALKLATPTTSTVTANGPSELAATTAHHNLVNAVSKSRKAFKGEHLLASDAVYADQIVRNAAAIIQAAYGEKAGITLVTGDDIIWSCLAGGIAARTALQQLNTYEVFELNMLDTDDFLKESLNYWQKPRRQMVDRFVTRLLKESQDFFKSSRPVAAPMVTEIAAAATNTFARVQALLAVSRVSEQQRAMLTSVVLSSSAHNIAGALVPDDRVSSMAIQSIALAELAASTFEDQAGKSVPPTSRKPRDVVRAAWASKRLSPNIMRNMKVARDVAKGAADPVNVIVDELLALDVSDSSAGSMDNSAAYYCPMGGWPIAVPGGESFSAAALSSKVVWMQQLKEASEELSFGVGACSTSSFVLQTFDLKTPLQDTWVGMGRHPLVIVRRDNKVVVGLANAPEDIDYKDDDIPVAVQTLRDVFTRRDAQLITGATRIQTQKLRAFAYNVERFVYALSLSELEAQNSVCIKLVSPDTVPALAVALAVYRVHQGVSATEFRISLGTNSDANAARESLEDIARRAGQLLDTGCKVCALPEVALCFCKISSMVVSGK